MWRSLIEKVGLTIASCLLLYWAAINSEFHWPGLSRHDLPLTPNEEFMVFMDKQGAVAWLAGNFIPYAWLSAYLIRRAIPGVRLRLPFIALVGFVQLDLCVPMSKSIQPRGAILGIYVGTLWALTSRWRAYRDLENEAAKMVLDKG